MVSRAADPSETQRPNHGNDHIKERIAACRKHQDHAGQEYAKDAVCDCASDAFPRTKAEKQTVQQISENDKYLKSIVNQIPLRCGEIAFSGVIRQSEDGELQKDKCTKQASQGQRFLFHFFAHNDQPP